MKTLLSASGQVGLVEVARADVEELVKDAEVALMADASLSASNETATDAKENKVYTILPWKQKTKSPTSVSARAGRA